MLRQASAKPGEIFAVSGNHASLGNWSVAEAKRLNYSDNIWTLPLVIDDNTTSLEYKYLILSEGNQPIWENCSARVISLTEGLTVEDTWSQGLIKTVPDSPVKSDNNTTGGRTKVKITFS